jgi:hypothetical protein
VSIFLIIAIWTPVLLAACGGSPPAYLPATAAPTLTASRTPTPLPPTATFTPTSTATPTPEPTLPPPAPCVVDLDYLQDLSIPDGTPVLPGSLIDKQWLVHNNGSCDWTAAYRLRLVSGDPLGAPGEQALYPARAGTQAVLRITFVAPLTPGTYRSVWQAVAPDDTPFGDPVTIEIVVNP